MATEEKVKEQPKPKPKKKVWLCKAVKSQKACFEAGEGAEMTRSEYDFKIEGWKDPKTGDVSDGKYRLENEDHVARSREAKIIEVYDTKEV